MRRAVKPHRLQPQARPPTLRVMSTHEEANGSTKPRSVPLGAKICCVLLCWIYIGVVAAVFCVPLTSARGDNAFNFQSATTSDWVVIIVPTASFLFLSCCCCCCILCCCGGPLPDEDPSQPRSMLRRASAILTAPPSKAIQAAGRRLSSAGALPPGIDGAVRRMSLIRNTVDAQALSMGRRMSAISAPRRASCSGPKVCLLYTSPSPRDS